jgi:hypothetical protein
MIPLLAAVITILPSVLSGSPQSEPQIVATTEVTQENTLSPVEIAGATQTQVATDFQLTIEASGLTEAANERIMATTFAPTQEAQRNATVNAILTETKAAVSSIQTLEAYTPRTVLIASPMTSITLTSTSLVIMTETPTNVSVIITRAAQNIRNGPGLNYGVLGQYLEDDTAQVIGTNADRTWVAISFRNGIGWLSRTILDVVGDLNSVPIMTPPPTPVS